MRMRERSLHPRARSSSRSSLHGTIYLKLIELRPQSQRRQTDRIGRASYVSSRLIRELRPVANWISIC